MCSAILRGAAGAAVLASLLSQSAVAQSQWTLGSAPVLRIVDDGTPAHNFANIRGVLRLSDGRVVIAENRLSELRVFSSRGALQKVATRRGEGPNELGAIQFVQTTPSGLLVFDGQRTVWFSLDSVRETRRVPIRSSARHSAMGALGSGAVWGSKNAGFRVVEKPTSELRRDSLEIVIFSSTLDSIAFTAGKRPGRSSLTITSSTVAHGFRGSMTRFAPQLLLAGSDDVLWFGDSGENRVSQLDARSGRTLTFALPVGIAPWNTRALDAERSRIMRTISAPADRELPLAELEPRWRGASRPVYSALYPDIDNGVWVELFNESAVAAKEILVLNAQGKEFARLALPSDLKVWEIGRDFVLGETRDVDGLSSVVLYRLDRR